MTPTTILLSSAVVRHSSRAINWFKRSSSQARTQCTRSSPIAASDLPAASRSWAA